MNIRVLAHFLSVQSSPSLIRGWVGLPLRSFHRTISLGNMASSVTSTFTRDVFKPPEGICPSLESINREAFKKTAVVPALRINKRQIYKVLKAFKPATIERARFQTIRDVPDEPEKKLLLLDPGKMADLETLTEKQMEAMEENEVEKELHEYKLDLTYNDWQAQEVLRCLLPADVEVPTGFSRIGHIIHLNLRQSQLPHKHLIGEVLLDKNQGVQTVVNKLNEIDNTYRFFNMECIAGEPNTVVTVKENHVTYSFDFAKVYWNPRLSTEHERIIGKLQRTDKIYDMFAGVGPFAIPAAKKGCHVHANDLNPESYHWLEKNAKQNKVGDKVSPSNLDGREFLRDVVKPDLIRKAQESFTGRAHVIMNLPAAAVEFLDAFPGLLEDAPLDLRDGIPKVLVHCHGFSKAEDPAEDIRTCVEGILGCSLDAPEIHDVRDVAPNKEMMCISFTMPSAVMFELPTTNAIKNEAERNSSCTSNERNKDKSQDEEPTSKKPRTV